MECVYVSLQVLVIPLHTVVRKKKPIHLMENMIYFLLVMTVVMSINTRCTDTQFFNMLTE